MILSVIGTSILFLLQVPTTKGSIEGVVVSAASGRPIAGAQINLTRMPTPLPAGAVPQGNAAPIGAVVIANAAGGIAGGVLSATGRVGNPPSANSDNTGRFVFQDVDAGSYRLFAVANGYAQQDYGSRTPGQLGGGTLINLAEGQSIKGVAFSLTPAGVVSGRVTGSTGEALVGIEVSLLKSAYDPNGQQMFRQILSALTDDRGEYRLFWAPPGSYYLSAGSSSRPMPGFNPFLNLSSTYKYRRLFYPGTPDSAAAVSVDVQPGAEASGMNFRLPEQQTYRIRGRVIDAAGSEVPRNASLSITPRDSLMASGSITSSSPYNVADGTFEFRDVPPGTYWIRAQLPFTTPRQPGAPPPRPPMAVTSVEVARGDVDGVILTVTPGRSISGQVRVDGQNPAGPGLERLGISLRPLSTGLGAPPPNPARVNTDGTFQVENVYPAEYSVTVMGLPVGQSSMYVKEIRFGGSDALSQPLLIDETASSGLQIVVGQNAGQIEGAVRDERQEPAANVQVVLVPDRRERKDLYKPGRTDINGRFRILGIPPGRYQIFAWQNMQDFSYFDPDVLKQAEGKGRSVIVQESSQAVVDVTLIR
jgi:hypothetical protein